MAPGVHLTQSVSAYQTLVVAPRLQTSLSPQLAALPNRNTHTHTHIHGINEKLSLVLTIHVLKLNCKQLLKIIRPTYLFINYKLDIYGQTGWQKIRKLNVYLSEIHVAVIVLKSS